MPEIVDVVNEKDEVIGTASRMQIYEKSLSHRIVHVLVLNNEGKIALQKRSKIVSYCPLHWCTSAGGHVQKGETYEEAAMRELSEELGIKAELTLLRKDFYGELGVGKFITTFVAKHNNSFTKNKDVESVEFFSMDEIKSMIMRGEKIHPELLFLLKQHFGI